MPSQLSKNGLKTANNIILPHQLSTCIVSYLLQHTLHSVTAYTAVHWLKQLVTGFSTRRPSFNSRLIHEGLLVEKVALGWFFLSVFQFSLVNNNPPYSSSSTCFSYQKDKQVTLENLPKNNMKYFHIPLVFIGLTVDNIMSHTFTFLIYKFWLVNVSRVSHDCNNK